MKHSLIMCVFLSLISSPAHAVIIVPTEADYPRILKDLADTTVGKDFRIVYTFQKDARICGGQGDAYIGQVQMNKYGRGYKDGKPEVTDLWIDIDKTYSIFVRDIGEPGTHLVDDDHCME